ncbi:hypothetical protein P5673_005255 [Acropora cervicornis]|uniref:Uncharacterized protein n=1 Tax=Acropora cervicornis TaxID=6130 RepID=A0AAD9VDE2_ACRCE|nr:hypothetical protein P5673_005255 [Acropora cervicornis]
MWTSILICVADLNEFKQKYSENQLRSPWAKNFERLPYPFPLLAMMQSFRPKLQKIIHDTWSEMEGIQREIAIVVALVQLYANQETPALLLCDAFQKRRARGFQFEELPLEKYTMQHRLVAEMLLRKPETTTATIYSE